MTSFLCKNVGTMSRDKHIDRQAKQIPQVFVSHLHIVHSFDRCGLILARTCLIVAHAATITDFALVPSSGICNALSVLC